MIWIYEVLLYSCFIISAYHVIKFDVNNLILRTYDFKLEVE